MRLIHLFRFVPHLHRNARVVARAGTGLGQVGVWLLATLLLLPYDLRIASLVAPLLGVTLLKPALRNTILSLGAVFVLYETVVERQSRYSRPLDGGGLSAVIAAMALGGVLLYLFYLAARYYRQLPPLVQRSPQACLHLFVWCALAAAWFGLPDSSLAPSALRLTIACLPFLVWRCGYMLLAGRRGRVASSGFQDHLFYLCPAYGGTHVPFGKGHDYLSESGARSAEGRARAQLAGIKLLVLAWIWKGTLVAIAGVLYGDVDNVVSEWLGGHSLGLSRLTAVIADSPGAGDSVAGAWLILFAELVRRTLSLAVTGHIIIGCLRLFGFNVFRNTYKPLLSQSIVDFWNRFHYYFKELLVEFFFFPTYLSWFKRRPKLRLLTATMAAAFFGNVYYHALRDLPALASGGVSGAWGLLAPRIFYGLLLAVGIYVSMLRQQKLRGKDRVESRRWSWILQLRRIAGVWLFYSIIHIWNVGPQGLTFGQRTAFFLSLFGYR
jgi:hypothetical protein